MVKLTAFEGEKIETVGFVSLSRGGVDRSKWKFDEDGFAAATSAALLQARQQMKEAIQEAHNGIVRLFHPNAYSRSVDGVDGADLDQIK